MNMDLANLATLLFISGNVHPYPGPISNHPHPRHPCSICHLDVGRDSLQCSACLKWVHFLCSFLTRADFCTICVTGTAVGLAMPSVPSPKENWLTHSDQSPCYAACVPSPLSRVPPTTAWLLSLTSTSGPPTLPLLHLLSRGR